MSDISKAAEGHWRELLPQLGVDTRYLVNRHGPCPICDGKDRFRWDDQNGGGGFICGQCGGGDGFDLAVKVTGRPFREVAVQVSAILGISSSFNAPTVPTDEMRQRDAFKRVWMGSTAPSEGGPVGLYLKTRVGCLWPSKSIREGQASNGCPVMVCPIVAYDGKRVENLHLTFLTPDGKKAGISPAKKVMPGRLPDGCAIRLAPAAACMGVAEGIENAISAAIMYDIPVWSCVNGTLLSKWMPPAVAEEITIFGDNDANYTGQAKAYHLANRLEVQHKRKVRVDFPSDKDTDFNDLHQKIARINRGDFSWRINTPILTATIADK